MDTTYNDILLKLSPYNDKVFFFPMSEREVFHLEKQMGQKFPKYYRQFLLTFGVRQDFVFELIQREEDYISEYQYLPKAIKKKFVPIGGSGAGGDTWLIKSSEPDDQRIYELWHEGGGEVTILDFTFNDLIQRNIEELKELYPTKPLNKNKNWCVQFAIDTTNEDLIIQAIDATKTKEWKRTEISTAGVYCYEAEIEIASKRISFRRQEYKDWKTPSYYFDWKEPAYDIGENSFIKAIDKKLKENFKGYKLIDYGILPQFEEEGLQAT